jgi:hypothetical protein
MRGVNIRQVQAEQGKIISTGSTQNTTRIELSENVFNCNEIYMYEYIVSATHYNISKDGSGFYLLANSAVNSTNNQY